MLRLVIAIAQLALAPLPQTATVQAPISKPRQAENNPQAVCKAWVNWVNATVVCQDIPVAEMKANSCLSRSCGRGGNAAAKFEDGFYYGSFDSGYPWGPGTLVRHDGSKYEGTFRKGEMWQNMTAYLAKDLLWKGDLASEVHQSAFGEWDLFEDSGASRTATVVRYGSLFVPPTADEIANARKRQKGLPGAPPAPKKPGYDLTPQYKEASDTHAESGQEKAICAAFWSVLDQNLPVYGRLGLPPNVTPELAHAKKGQWEQIARRADGASYAADFKEWTAKHQHAYDIGVLDEIGSWAGTCVNDPKS